MKGGFTLQTHNRNFQPYSVPAFRRLCIIINKRVFGTNFCWFPGALRAYTKIWYSGSISYHFSCLPRKNKVFISTHPILFERVFKTRAVCMQGQMDVSASGEVEGTRHNWDTKRNVCIGPNPEFKQRPLTIKSTGKLILAVHPSCSQPSSLS